MKLTTPAPESLLANYLPADYIDQYAQTVSAAQPISPERFNDLAFNNLPGWINALMKLRNLIVKPLGLDTATPLANLICDQTPNELVWGMHDKHLDFHVSMSCGQWGDNRQTLAITTAVKYNNRLGRLYFFVIRPFHGIIIRSILRRIARHTN